jgi:hypothetical protein
MVSVEQHVHLRKGLPSRELLAEPPMNEMRSIISKFSARGIK